MLLARRTSSSRQRMHDLPERTDDELMQLARAGMNEAFDALVRRHQKRALRLALRYLGQPALAQDAVQNCFVELYQALPRYRVEGRFAAFFYRVLLNQCRMAVRQQAANRRRVAAWGDASRALDPPCSGHDPTRRDPHDDSAQAEAWAHVTRLSNKLQLVVLLRYGEDLSHEEIAARLGLPVGTVKSRLFAALKRLRQLLEKRP